MNVNEKLKQEHLYNLCKKKYEEQSKREVSFPYISGTIFIHAMTLNQFLHACNKGKLPLSNHEILELSDWYYGSDEKLL